MTRSVTTANPSTIPIALQEALLSLAKQIAGYANEATERLSFEEYADLMELEATLRACHDLAAAEDPIEFMTATLEQAGERFAYIRQRSGGDA